MQGGILGKLTGSEEKTVYNGHLCAGKDSVATQLKKLEAAE